MSGSASQEACLQLGLLLVGEGVFVQDLLEGRPPGGPHARQGAVQQRKQRKPRQRRARLQQLHA